MTSYTQGWYFSKRDLMKPLREGGTDWDTAVEFRRNMYLFVTKLGRKLELPQLTQSTCEVYFHRFFARRDFVDHDRHVIATACMFLAAKVEEVHRKLRDVLRQSYELQYAERLEIDSEKYNNFKRQVLVAERLVLQTIAFDLTVEHPHRFLQEQVKLLDCAEEKRKEFMQTAWSFVNDSFASTVCLQYRPQLVAAAAIYLASKNVKIEPKPKEEKDKGKEWWQALNVNLNDLTDVTTQILESFPQEPSAATSSSAPSSSPNTFHANSSIEGDLAPGQRLKRKEPDLPNPPMEPHQ